MNERGRDGAGGWEGVGWCRWKRGGGVEQVGERRRGGAVEWEGRRRQVIASVEVDIHEWLSKTLRQFKLSAMTGDDVTVKMEFHQMIMSACVMEQQCMHVLWNNKNYLLPKHIPPSHR